MQSLRREAKVTMILDSIEVSFGKYRAYCAVASNLRGLYPKVTIYLVLIRKAVSYWEIRTKQAFSSPDFGIVIC